MNKLFFILLASLVFLGGFYFFITKSNTKKAEADFKLYCGSCHLAPAPEQLTKEIWRKNILPEMGARLGIKTGEYDPYKGLSFKEKYKVVSHGIYPAKPLLSEKKWKSIVKYITDNAPKEIPVDKSRKERNSSLEQFIPHKIAVDDKPGSFITGIFHFPHKQRVAVGDAYGNVYSGQGSHFSKAGAITSPVVSVIEKDSFDVVTGIGTMPPTEQKSGKIFQLGGNGVARLLIDTLHRPVFTALNDLNDDGVEETIVCEYGNKIGQLTLFRKSEDSGMFVPEALLTLPGTLRVIIEDMDNDGRKDIVALHAQGDEGVTVLYQVGNLEFRAELVIRLSPVLGTSWFELFDYDGDGDKDIAVASGDNADLSFMQKPYHGLRVFLNTGNKFQETFFYPIYGATRVAANDFDADGDVDFAICSFFPDYANNPEESFVYLENTDPKSFQFKSYTFNTAISGRWMVMEQGDMDGDGDIDLMLGSFMHSPAPTPEHSRDEWKTANVDLIFMENKLF